jgi:protein TonB
VLAVAIQAQGSILGVLEVFSSQPSVFDSTHVAALQQIANVLAPLAALVSEQVEPPVADRFSAVAAESVPRAPERSEGPPSAIPVEAPKRLVDSPSPTVRPESVSPAAWPEILQAVKKRVPHSFAKKFSVVRAFLAGIVTLIVFVLLFLFGGSLLRAIRTSSTTAATAVRLASGGPRPDEGTIDPTGASARDKIEATRIDSAYRPLVERASSKELLHASPAATKPAESIAAASVPTEPPIDAPAVEPSPVAAASAPPPVVLDSHPVRTTQAETGAAPSLDAAMVAPTAESALAGMTPAVNASVRPAPRVNADLPVPVGGQIKQPLLVSQVSPEYPALARQTGIQGVVVVEIVIEKSGSVGDVKVVSGPPVLRQAAVDAVRRWKYQITLLDGEPVAVRMSVTIRFTYS